MDSLSAERLRELLDYDPETGVFTWRGRPGNGVRAGAVAGRVLSTGYRSIKVDRVEHFAHRLVFLYVTGAWPQQEVDHVDCVKDNNRWANLRDVDHSTNKRNLRRALSTNRLGVLGVDRYRTGKYRATARGIDGRQVHLGHHKTIEEASAAFKAFKAQLPGAVVHLS
jgi:hypothetical protein